MTLAGVVLFAVAIIFVIWQLATPTPADRSRAQYDELRAEVDPLDEAWIKRVEADANQTVRLIRTGNLYAMLSIHDHQVSCRNEFEGINIIPGEPSILDLRNKRRWNAWIDASNRVEQERQRAQDAIDSRKSRDYEARRQQECAEEARRQAEAEAAQKQVRAAAEAEARALNERIERKVRRPWPLQDTAGVDGITLGTRVADGTDLIVPLKRLQHMLVVGASGAGKSVFVQQLVFQLVNRSPDVEQVIIFDLKGGVEFNRYQSSPRTKLIWEFADVAIEVANLSDLMRQREAEMRAEGLQNYPGKRVFVIIDEYAEIQSEIDSATTKEEKADARAVATNLVRLGRRARALGIVLVCALQKATTDAMDSALRTNLNCRICLRVNSRQFAASVLDDLDDLPVNPLALKPGQFIYYDATRGELSHAVAQIAPGVQLDG